MQVLRNNPEKTREVVLAPEACDGLKDPHLFIFRRAGVDRSMACAERIEAYCRDFVEFPERGVQRDDLLPGLRVVGSSGG